MSKNAKVPRFTLLVIATTLLLIGITFTVIWLIRPLQPAVAKLDSTSTRLSMFELFSPSGYATGAPGIGRYIINTYDSDALTQLSFRVSLDTISYSLIQGKRIFQGDIFLTDNNEVGRFQDKFAPVEFFAQDKNIRQLRPATRPTRKQKQQIFAVSEKAINSRWTNAQINYAIDDNLTTSAKTNIMKAISWWTSAIRGLNFNPVDPTNPPAAYVYFTAGSGYGSSVGMTGTKQDLTLPNNSNVGNIAHEIGHVLGLWHEQSHPDRDLYVTILEQNLQFFNDPIRDANLKEQFSARPAPSVDTTTYDFGSIMHYPANAFAKDGTITIEPKPAFRDKIIGQRERLSDLDIAQVKKIYKL